MRLTRYFFVIVELLLTLDMLSSLTGTDKGSRREDHITMYFVNTDTDL